MIYPLIKKISYNLIKYKCYIIQIRHSDLHINNFI